MALFRIIFFLLLFTPAMIFLSGCYDDRFLESMNEEVDFIAPFDVVLTTEESKRTTYFPITDTGLTISVMAGDDASYNNIPGTMNFTESNISNGNSYGDDRDTDDIIHDNITDLTWTKCTAIAYNTMDRSDNCSGSHITKLSDTPLMEWSKAAETCKNLNYAGRTDWRLPRLPELLTIVNYGFHPAFDPDIFPHTRGDFESLQYTDNHYSIDDRTRFIRETNGEYTPVSPGASNYTAAKYVNENGIYIFNEDYKDIFKLDSSGAYIRVYIPLANYPVSNRYRFNDPNYIQDNNGAFYKVGTSPNEKYIPLGDMYAYDAIWGFEFYVNAYGALVRVYIVDSEDHYKRTGVDYSLDITGKFVRLYKPDVVENKYPVSTYKHYRFNGTKFYEDVSIQDTDTDRGFIQIVDTPLGYWTYSSKLMFDGSMNTADYGWVVFFQNGGPLGVNMATYLLKTKEDLTFEKQFVRCVCGGNGDLDDVNY